KSELAQRRAISKEEGKQFAKENGPLFLVASTRTGENIDDAFTKTATNILQKIREGVIVTVGVKLGYGRLEGQLGGRGGAPAKRGRCCN
ncbi:hypothetical protein CDL12_12246, partial [Handroanthus impetiginosus]